MPIYEFRCSQCGKVSEILVGIGSEDDVFICKYCGSDDLEKIISVSSFTFSNSSQVPGTTCCGREERCDAPPCSTGGVCRKES